MGEYEINVNQEESPEVMGNAPTLDDITGAVENAVYTLAPELYTAVADAVANAGTFDSDDFFNRLDSSLDRLAEVVSPESDAALMEAEPEPTPTPDGEQEEILRLLTEIRADVALRPALTTKFEDYTVSEGILLLLLLFVIIGVWVAMLRRGFAWLNW